MRESVQDTYVRSAVVAAPPDRLFTAVSTIAGLQGWWTTRVSGAPGHIGGDVRFEFDGLDEHILMRVDAVEARRLVAWTCLTHTSRPEWDGTRVLFAIGERGPSSAELTLQHIGLAPDWDHFFTSLVAYAEQGAGMPFGR
jgi:uncharacterized protein YndB with AHSA1/START domain